MEVIKGVPFFLTVTHNAGLHHLEKSTWCTDVVINRSYISYFEINNQNVHLKFCPLLVSSMSKIGNMTSMCPRKLKISNCTISYIHVYYIGEC